jgi:carbamate kinase
VRVVVALGGNALLKRGEPMTAENQRKNVRIAAEALAPVAADHDLVVTHGNGPQVGLLALQGAAYDKVEAYPFDVLGAETEGMIGYMIEQELGNLVPFERPFATILTMIEVDPDDPAFQNPTKFIGPVYDKAEAHRLASETGWVVKPDGDKWRRVVPSPIPKRVFELRPIQWLLERHTIVIAAGGGGIPTMYAKGEERRLLGVEAVIDKDLASELLARDIGPRSGRSTVRPRPSSDGTPSLPAPWAPRSMPPASSPRRRARPRRSAPWPTCRRSSGARRARSSTRATRP